MRKQPRGFALTYASAFVPVGSVPWRPLPKSKYVPSPYGFVSPTFKPSVMTNSAYLKWFSKLCRPRGRNLSNSEYFRSVEILNTEFGPFVTPGVSTLQEVLLDIDWSKSPGWDYVNRGCNTKREAWDQFSDEIADKVYRLLRGEHVDCLFIATLKDELLPEGKTARVFLPAPFHHQLACAMLFKKTCDSLNRTVHHHSSAVGMDPFGRGLERGLRRLSDLPYGYDADQSGCDTSCKDTEPERDFMKRGLPVEYHPAVDVLFNLAMCPHVIVGDSVLSLVLNPSGWYLTTAINTLRTHRMVASAYLDEFPNETINDMRLHLKQLNGGDDLAYSTDKVEFDICCLARRVAEHGMYLESDVLTPRNPMSLTFYSSNLLLRYIDLTKSYSYVAAGRLAKLLSAFSFLKTAGGKIDYYRNAARVVGLMHNLWPYKYEFDSLGPYLYHLVHHFFYLSGRVRSGDWDGLFRSMPCDTNMLLLLSGHKFEKGSVFSPSPLSSSVPGQTRVFQSALKSFVVCIIMPRGNRTIEKILDSLEQNSHLSRDGREWLTASADPFRDQDYALAGFPDAINCATVVQLIKKQIQVVVPTSGPGIVTANANWDCSIALIPDMTTTASNNDVGYGYLVSAQGLVSSGAAQTNPVPLGGLAISAGPQGNALWLSSANGGGSSVPATFQSLGIAEFCKGNCRIIGMAFEVVNTTAEINKQGQATVWRVPDQASFINLNQGYTTAPPVNATYPTYLRRSPPATIAAAQLLFGSRSWAASEGAYIVSRLNSAENPMSQPQFLNQAYSAGDLASGVANYVFLNQALGTNGANASRPAPFDISGVTFSGLSYNTTLTVNVRWIVERMPTADEPDLVVLATPSATYDPLALELYTRCMIDQPPGVMLKENPLGEWFRSALGKVAEWAPKLGDAIGTIIPGAKLLGNVIGGGARVVSNLIPGEKAVMPGSASTTALFSVPGVPSLKTATKIKKIMLPQRVNPYANAKGKFSLTQKKKKRS